MENGIELKPGTVLRSRYVIERVIGAGGFGITYLACDPLLDVKVAIKEYRQGTERFLREARITAGFRTCRNIVYVYDYFEEYGAAYIVMEYLEGETLKQRVLRNGSLLPKEAVRIMISILKAIEAVHGAGFVHRDISPDNICLLKNGKVKLFDFGSAVRMDENGKEYTEVKHGYSPPEQYDRHSGQKAPSDIYSAGATLYMSLTSTVPDPAPERTENPALNFTVGKGKRKTDRHLIRIIRKAMNPNTAERYKNAQEFRRELETWLNRENLVPFLMIFLSVAAVVIFLTLRNAENKEDPAATIRTTEETEEASVNRDGSRTKETPDKFPETQPVTQLEPEIQIQPDTREEAEQETQAETQTGTQEEMLPDSQPQQSIPSTTEHRHEKETYESDKEMYEATPPLIPDII